jgi:amino-acid N-acetyltransferase
MKVRRAKISDAENIQALISQYAELDRMLPRSLADIYENLQSFLIAEDDKGLVSGCCALQVIWSDLAEIKSLAVQGDSTGKGIGRALVEAAIQQSNDLGLFRVFTLTLEPAFFERLQFTRVSKEQLPMKVWSDCAKCSKQNNCDEVALIHESGQK